MPDKAIAALEAIERRMLDRVSILVDDPYPFNHAALTVIAAALTALAAGQRLDRIAKEDNR